MVQKLLILENTQYSTVYVVYVQVHLILLYPRPPKGFHLLCYLLFLCQYAPCPR